ncbi:MAG: amidohydrolase family protein [Pseudomonadota bacterium]|nr:amidohydrolase family protein [Pseudomonadota bacterium]
MRVVDPHIHLWNIETLHYPWLVKPGRTFMGDYAPLIKTHEPREFLADAGDIEVLKVVHIDAGHDPADPLAETQWLQSLADAPESKGIPHGIVAYADLSTPDVEQLLAAHAAHPNVRGIRQILNVHPDPLYDYVGRHFMREGQWRKGFGLLKKYRLSFDLQLYPTQMAEAAALAREHPDTQLILNHTGMFVDRSSVAGWRAWRDGLRTLAACPNIAAKISGLGMIDHQWTVESLRPYALETIDAFGVERCLFASNFPVDRLYSSYADLWRAYAAIVGGASGAEKEALFRANALRIYRL